MTTPEIARLNPFDGLFLRAVHLQQIQLYAQALARALGIAGGPGVVHGFGLALAGAPGEPPSLLTVRPGLAVDADGRILLSESTIAVDLPGPGQTVVWRVELVDKEEPFGQENSYGDICVDPCEEGVSTAPFIGEGVDVRLSALTPPSGLDTASPSFRNRVASWYFERERRSGGPIIAASDRDAESEQGRPITGADWAAPTGAPSGPVAIGLLLRTSQGFVLDVWAARRDRVQTPPETGWMNRLAMRPWPVFIAQLLQFQDQLGSAWPGTGGTTAPGQPMVTSVRADVSSRLTEALRLLHNRKLREPSDLLENALAVLHGDQAAAPVISLLELGFDELPPAGYLPAQRGFIYDRIPALFPEETGIVINTYRADTIVELVARAQHADRIPLTPDGGVWPPRIEIMVPVPEPYTDGRDLQTTRSWVAFRRAVYIPSYTEDPVTGADVSPEPAVTASAGAGTATPGTATPGTATAGTATAGTATPGTATAGNQTGTGGGGPARPGRPAAPAPDSRSGGR
jgi:hypothetical protein